MRRTEREGIVSKILTCSVLCAGVAAFALAADPRPEPGGQAWSESAYRNFLAPQAILGGRFVVSDEARDPGLTAALPQDQRALQGQLHEADHWRVPFAGGDTLHVYVARKEAGGVRRLAARSIERGRLVGASIQIDATGMSDEEIVREIARLYAVATLTAYGAPDSSFLTTAAADYLTAGIQPEQDREEALLAAAAPGIDLPSQSAALGRFYVDEFARAAGGSAALRAVWEKAAESDANIQWTRKFFDAMQPFLADGVYVNYLGDEGQDRVRAAYGGDKYDRLVELKNKYDPTNFFRLNQNIKPSV